MKKFLVLLPILAGMVSCEKEDAITRRDIQLVDGITNQPVSGVEVKVIVGCKSYSNPGPNSICTNPVFDSQTSDGNGQLALAENSTDLFTSSHPNYYDVSKTSSMSRQRIYRLYPRAKANMTIFFSDEQGFRLNITSDAPARKLAEVGSVPSGDIFSGGNYQVEKKSGTGVIDLIADTDNEILISYTNGILQQQEKIIRVKPGRGELMNITVTF